MALLAVWSAWSKVSEMLFGSAIYSTTIQDSIEMSDESATADMLEHCKLCYLNTTDTEGARLKSLMTCSWLPEKKSLLMAVNRRSKRFENLRLNRAVEVHVQSLPNLEVGLHDMVAGDSRNNLLVLSGLAEIVETEEAASVYRCEHQLNN